LLHDVIMNSPFYQNWRNTDTKPQLVRWRLEAKVANLRLFTRSESCELLNWATFPCPSRFSTFILYPSLTCWRTGDTRKISQGVIATVFLTLLVLSHKMLVANLLLNACSSSSIWGWIYNRESRCSNYWLHD
jgi:hypothetical protein